MKILYAGLQKEYYDTRRGFSFEERNFFSSLRAMPGIEAVAHPFDRILDVGKMRYNYELYERITHEKPDLFFAFMYTDELEPRILQKIRNETHTKTLAWFADDYWRFWNYSKHWAPYFDWAVTTYSRAVAWHRRAGCMNVIRSQWACNPDVFKPLTTERDIEVSFVGQYKGPRGRIVRGLSRQGIDVQTFGSGWQNGRVSEEEMIRIFSRSKVTLNLNARERLFSPRVLARLFLRKSLNRLTLDSHVISNLNAYLHFPVLHTHARPFELAGCRAFVISGRSEDIGDCYAEGEEMIFYDSMADLAEKIRYYLTHDAEREKIAQAAYARTLREHTYELRFQEIFRKIGMWHE